MKKLYALPLALIFTLPAQAGVWDLFPLGNATYYADSAQQPVSVELYRMDSVLPGSVEDVSYFNKRARSLALGACESTLFDPFSYLTYLDQNSFNDSLISRNDTVFFNSGYGNLPFYFLPKASVGQSWTVTSDWPGNSFNQITITCTSVQQQTFLGFTDSVKVFSLVSNGSSPGQVPISNFQIRLSKAHGLLEFVPFDQFLYHPSYVDFRSLKIVGLDDGSTAVGFRMPGFSDFFHLHAGDVQMWQIYNRSADVSQPTYVAYIRDSIITSLITPDSVVYQVHRTNIDAEGNVTGSFMMHHRYIKTDYDKYFDAGTNGIGVSVSFSGSDPWFPFGFVEPLLLFIGTYEMQPLPASSDTITSWTIASPGLVLDTLGCEVGQISDIDYSFKMDTRSGYTYINTGDFQPFSIYTKTLIGSVINGVEEGDVTLSVNTLNSFNGQAFTLIPNPAKESITFQGLPSGTVVQYAIYDGLGRQAMHGALPATSLSVEGLQPGVYMVQVRLADRTEMARFVKE